MDASPTPAPPDLDAEQPWRCRVITPFASDGSRPWHRGQIGGFLMEAPTTSVATAITMIAPKRVVMIDALAQTIDGLAPASAEDSAPPSPTTGPLRGRRRRTRFLSAERRVQESAPVTCSTCRMTYLPTAVPPASGLADWVCDCCRQSLRRQQG